MKTEIKSEYLGGERKNTLKHELVAMKIALLSSLQSKDPSTQVGACIEKNNKIVSTGFNHNPFKWNSNEFPWRNDISNIGEENTKYPYVIHAELDAISKCSDMSLLDDSTIYVTLFPCIQCAKLIVSFGIKKVVYGEYRDSIENDCSRRLLEKCGVEVIQSRELEKDNQRIRIKI